MKAVGPYSRFVFAVYGIFSARKFDVQDEFDRNDINAAGVLFGLHFANLIALVTFTMGAEGVREFYRILRGSYFAPILIFFPFQYWTSRIVRDVSQALGDEADIGITSWEGRMRSFFLLYVIASISALVVAVIGA